MLFVIVGIIGEYIAILFAEIKDRPVYIVKDTENFRKNQSRDADGQNDRQVPDIVGGKPRKHWENITKS